MKRAPIDGHTGRWTNEKYFFRQYAKHSDALRAYKQLVRRSSYICFTKDEENKPVIYGTYK